MPKSSVKRCVICLNWGTKYGPEYVNCLYNAVQKHLTYEHDFLCLTDNPEGLANGVKPIILDFDLVDRSHWPSGQWPKLAMFDPNVSGEYEQAVFLDLDSMIIGDLDRLFDLLESDFDFFMTPTRPAFVWRLLPASFRKAKRGGSTVLAFKPNTQNHILDNWTNDNLKIDPNDEAYIYRTRRNMGLMPHKFCQPFGAACVPRGMLKILNRKYLPPRDCSVLFFGTGVKPIDLADPDLGEWKSNRRTGYGTVAWVKDYFDKFRV